jgi:hypothetical protein
MKIVVQKEVTVNLPEVKVLAIRDVFEDKKIVAKIQGLPRGIVLWGPEDYDSHLASTWTNESVQTRAKEVLKQIPVPFE